ncbi:MAG: N-succinylarginine dihydrolase [Bacteriovoracaceae bacterium]
MQHSQNSFEVNFDGLVGQNHNYAGLSHGNVASMKHSKEVSSPKKAALQGLMKMKALSDMGIRQAVLPPHFRPHLKMLQKLGYKGSPENFIPRVALENPSLLLSCYSSSAMWTANAATVSPSANTKDRKVHFTPANLVSKLHRSIETQFTAKVLKSIFKNPKHFRHHAPLPHMNEFGDEGAANHTRLCSDFGQKGIEFFVYGKSDKALNLPEKYPARQDLKASKLVSELHLLKHENLVFAQQNPDCIDAGVFHNDVICVGHKDRILVHERAYINTEKTLKELKKKFKNITNQELKVILVKDKDVTLKDAVDTYLFNSQIVTNDLGETGIIAPLECLHNTRVNEFLNRLVNKKELIQFVSFFDVKESMKNGGGPACLRLRVELTAEELQSVHPGVILTEKKYNDLIKWVKSYYREELHPRDLLDPRLAYEIRDALLELENILELPGLYDDEMNGLESYDAPHTFMTL